jgi:hypothetical protein
LIPVDVRNITSFFPPLPTNVKRPVFHIPGLKYFSIASCAFAIRMDSR